MKQSEEVDSEDNLDFLREKHIHFIRSIEKLKDSEFEYWIGEHLRMSGVYWGLTALSLMEDLKADDVSRTIDWIKKCQHQCGGFGGNLDHDPHILYTLSAVQVLCLAQELHSIDLEGVTKYVAGLQKPDGSFAGDEWGEIDTRFGYCAVTCLALIGRLDAINRQKAVDFVMSCMNFDGAFGCIPSAESHAGQTFCCLGALAVLGELQRVPRDKLGWWLAERQVSGGGLNGRPEKLPDVCYSWWVLSSLKILDRENWIDGAQLGRFILRAQDAESGGIADRPGDMPDVFHTFFGIAGLSLLKLHDLFPVDPVFALPVPTLRSLPSRPLSLVYGATD